MGGEEERREELPTSVGFLEDDWKGRGGVASSSGESSSSSRERNSSSRLPSPRPPALEDPAMGSSPNNGTGCGIPHLSRTAS